MLGSSRLKVSSVGLGTSTWGIGVDATTAEEQLKAYLSAGGNMVDTADIYGLGASEEILGTLLAKLGARDDIILATKAGGVSGGKPRLPNASPLHLRKALDESLRKLRTNYIDLWQLHDWDDEVALEETMSALDWAVSSGRVRHVGICNYSGRQTAAAAALQACDDRAPLVSTQVEYSLLDRSIEVDVLPVAAEKKLGVMAWAPLGRGVLSGKYRHGVPRDRAENAFFQYYVGHFLDERSAKIVEVVVDAAEQLGHPPAAIAIAWLLSRPGVDIALVGARTAEQLSESLVAGSVTLPSDLREALDNVSEPMSFSPPSLPPARASYT
jgi:aryl-alcohol dehydrogenase-like predicted oxidoreductase